MSLGDKIFKATTAKNKVVKVNHTFGVYPREQELEVEVSSNAGDMTPPENTAWWIKITHDHELMFRFVHEIASALEQVFHEYTERDALGYSLESTCEEGGITHLLRITSWGEIRDYPEE